MNPYGIVKCTIKLGLNLTCIVYIYIYMYIHVYESDIYNVKLVNK
jgi:hypothetical protein